MRTYLDDLPVQNDPTSPEARADVKAKGKEWFQHSESFTGNLDMAFKLWDAVSAASTVKRHRRRPLTHCRCTKDRRTQEKSSRMLRCLRTPTSGWLTDGDVMDGIYDTM